jgi:hypothetical protein
MNSPTQRSLKLLRDNGYTAAITEHFNSFIKIRQDLFGFIDIIAIRSDLRGVLGVQTTTKANMPARIEKISHIEAHKVWLEAGNKINVHGWRKLGKKGKRKLWQVDVRELTV